MKLARSQIAAAAIALAVVLSAAATTWFYLRPRSVQDRVYRIGWAVFQPYQFRGADGQPAGIAVELVQEAARRRGIRLEWIFTPEGPDAGLLSRKLDLWPLLTGTPERLKTIYVSEPIMEFERCLLVPADSPFRSADQLAKSTISVTNGVVEYGLLHGRLPEARIVQRTHIVEVMEDLCGGQADAAFMDTYRCAGRPLRWIGVPDVHSRLGIGSLPEDRAAADALRDEIGAISDEGKLSPILAHSGFISAQHLESMQAALSARRREAELIGAASLFALLFLLAALQTMRFGRERNYSRRTAQSLRSAEQQLRLLANNLKEVVLAFDMDRELIYANSALESFSGATLGELEAAGWSNWFHAEDRPRMLALWEKLFEGNSFQDQEFRVLLLDGTVKWVSATWGPLLDETGRQIGVQGSAHEITSRKAAEDALRESQERYQQAQKLESIGRLAGGVAHDFNNLLTVINGYSEMVYQELPEDDPIRPRIHEILSAGTRAAELTQQLLAFSRKQMIQPRPLDLNAVVVESERLLRRLLGEDIEWIARLRPGLSQILADPGQIHQVLMNLVVNARDAMPDGGKLIVETAEIEVDSQYVTRHPEAAPGHYVQLTVTDSGTGMDPDTLCHIFEPFFTTKGVAKGTGLGLATVYGIVKQNHGWIGIETKPGAGTSFRIYLPGIAAQPSAIGAGNLRRPTLNGLETVLVVEDQADVRRLATGILHAHNYTVLEAPDATTAIDLAERHPSPIHLLLTDVVLPGMNGRELAERLRVQRPEIKILYTSGYTRDVIAHRGVLDREVCFIPKPYSPEALAAKVREVLGTRPEREA